MTKHYHLSNIRTLLIQGFTAEELRRLCYDAPLFRPVYDELARNTGKNEIIDRLLEYAGIKLLLDDLLTLIQRLNPAQFEQHRPYIQATPSISLPEDRCPVEQAQEEPESAGGEETFSPPPPSSPSDRPHLTNPKNLLLPPGAEVILKQMFAGYRRVIIEKEFGGGFSGGRVLLLRPIRHEDRPELPAVVKMASVSLIAKERRAYQDFIQDRLPNAIGIRNIWGLTADSEWAGLRYPLMGNGTFAFQSLREYCRTATLEDIRFVLENRLLKAIEALLQFNRVRASFSLQASYDSLLPLNLLVQPGAVPAGMKPLLLTPQAFPDVPLKQGDYVRLEGFVVTKVDLVDGTVTLNVPVGPDDPPASYSLRLKSVAGLASYQADQLIKPIEGVVLETRQERLEAEAGRALGAGFNPAQELLTLPDGTRLPNPLLKLPHFLSQMPHVRVGTIHGDLNMENVLVDPSIREISLIDFAAAREDHVLHDFLRLETEVIVKLIPELLAQANLGAGVICPFYEQLHQFMLQPTPSAPPELPHPTLIKPLTMLMIIRTTARKYFFNPDDWTEYYQGLALYLLGALKFASLDQLVEAPAPLPKQVAFLGAGVIGKMYVEPPQINLKRRIQIYMQGDFSSLSADRRSAAIDAFAAILGIVSQAIEVYGVYEGSIVFDLGIPTETTERLRILLRSNDAQLRLLKVEKVILKEESGKTAEWVIREGKFDLVTPIHSTASSNVQEEPQIDKLEPASILTIQQRMRLKQKLDTLQQEWNLRSERVRRVRVAYAIEVSPAVRFQLEQQLQDEETALGRLDSQINEIEQKLR